MKKRVLSLVVAPTLFVLFTPALVQSQCTNTALGSSCVPGAFNTTSLVLSADLGTTNKTYTNIGVGYNYLWATYNGACYTVSSCGAGIDTQIGLFSPTLGMGTPFAYDDDNGPSCTGTAASVNFVSNYSGNCTMTFRQYNCNTSISSVTTTIRQNNNLTITSSSADMCAGTTRTLTATPTPVGSTVPGAGNPGAFSGTGVSGTTFTAPTPAGASATYTITYTFGYCSTTQNINVYRAPLGSITTPSQTVCTSSLALTASTTYGTGTWTASDPGVTFSPNNTTANATANNLPVGTTTLTWTVSNGPCANAVYTINVTRTATGNGTWIGGTSTDWNTAANWCGGVPTTTTDVIIPDASSTAFDPYVTVPTAVCRDITLQNNSLLFLNAGQTLTVYGSWYNNSGNAANVNANSTSNVIMNNGTGIIGGNTATTFGNFTNNSPGDITLNQNATVSNTLTMSGNFFISAGNILTLGTSAANTGTLTMGGVYWITGTGYFRRYFNNTTNTAAQGLFPFGQVPGAYRRDATIQFTGAPSAGGYIDGRYMTTPLTLYTGLPITNDAGVTIQNYMNEGYWDLTPGGGLTGGTYSLQLQYDGIATINTPANLRIIKSPGPAHTTWVANGTHGTVSGSTTAGYVTRTGMSGFSWFVISSSNSDPLPVELIHFEAGCQQGTVRLDWATASEQNNQYFSIERSKDGTNWYEIGRVTGAGNSNELRTYDFNDTAPLEGTSYYRLVQVDVDGQSQTFEPAAVNCYVNANVSMLLYPNPATDEAMLDMYADREYPEGNIRITDVSGRRVKEISVNIAAGQNKFALSGLNALHAGIYYVQISGNGKDLGTAKLAVR